MEILWWLAPPAVVTVLAMAWAGWRGRERTEVSREVAIARMGEALAKPPRAESYRAPQPSRETDRSTGIAVRPSRRSA